MTRNALIAALAGVLLAGCATTEPGWTGQGATAFGEAEAACQANLASIADEKARQQAFDDCMASKGWSRK